MTDLVFRQTPLSNPADLVFGEFEGTPPDSYIAINATFGAPEFAAVVAPRADITLAADFAAPIFSASVGYDVDVARPVVCGVGSRSQVAQPMSLRVASTSPGFAPLRANTEHHHQKAATFSSEHTLRLPGQLAQHRVAVESHHTGADPLRASTASRHQQMLPLQRPVSISHAQQAVPLRAYVLSRSQDMTHDRRPWIGQRTSVASPLSARVASSHQKAARFQVERRSRFQQAMRPPAGISPPVVPPVADPCYTPNGALVFKAAASTDGALIFVCDNHSGGDGSTVVVPIRRIYMVTNIVSLVRAIDGVPVPVDSLSASLDVDSWAWGVQATLPRQALALVKPTADGPVALVATINGMAIHFIAEQVGRARTGEPSAPVRIQGRGLIAELDAPYAPTLTFSNSESRNAQQLMADVLTVNGSPMDWTVDWGLDDWLVPAGAWSHQGTYITALTAIAKAAGGYLLPHASTKSLKVLHRYPTAPWNWGDVTPDLILPPAVARSDSMDWLAKPAYNRVFVQGQAQGMEGEIIREGTAGDLVAPQVVDQLLTAVPALRQRGRAELSQGGRQITVGLGLPVLAETGIILPGTFLEYDDPETPVRGLVRSVSVEASFPNVWQSIGVETHV